MTKAELLEKYKGGFSFGRDFDTVEVLINDQDTDDNKLCLWAYDGAFMPLPNITSWSQSGRDKLINQLRNCLADLNADVWIDDLQIKEYQNED